MQRRKVGTLSDKAREVLDYWQGQRSRIWGLDVAHCNVILSFHDPVTASEALERFAAQYPENMLSLIGRDARGLFAYVSSYEGDYGIVGAVKSLSGRRCRVLRWHGSVLGFVECYDSEERGLVESLKMWRRLERIFEYDLSLGGDDAIYDDEIEF